MADPVQGSICNPQSLNRFTYGLSDPINNIDPTGLFNFKVEIPSDWPCNPADNVACGCDPFESPFCGIGGSYPPSDSGGGGGGPIRSVPHECQIKAIPSDAGIHVCRGSHWTAGLGLVGPGVVQGYGQVTQLKVTAEGHGNPKIDEAVTETTGPAVPSGLRYHWDVPFKFTKPGKKGDSAFIQWHISYSCLGGQYNLDPLATVAYCY